jgi:hypothetical protein
MRFGIIASSFTQTVSDTYDLAMSSTSSPFVVAYPFVEGIGFGAKYADPAVIPGNGPQAVASGLGYSSDKLALAVAYHNVSPFVTAWAWSFGVGFGTKYADPSPAPTANKRVAQFVDSTGLLVAGSGGEAFRTYAWTSGGGFGSKYADPSPFVFSSGFGGCRFSPSSTKLVVSTSNTFIVYPWNPGYGTAYTGAPASLGGGLTDAAFTSTESDICIAHAGSPYLSAFPLSGTTIGTKYANPASLLPSTANSVSFSPDDAYMLAGSGGATTVHAYAWTNGVGFGTKIANPGTLPFGGSYGSLFSASQDTAFFSNQTTPFIFAYVWTGSGFGSKYANPASLAPGTCYSLALV